MENSDEIKNDVLLNNEQETTTYSKGRELEQKFSEFMKEKLGWEQVRVGSHMTGKHNGKGTMIDVLGERLDARGKTYKIIGYWYMAFCLILVICGVVYGIEGDDATGMLVIIGGGVVIYIAGLIFLLNSNKYNKENAWVECKNLKGKANINQIRKALEEYLDYKRSGNEKYKFVNLYFVSANGYIENAINYAIEHNIICYTFKNGKFEKAKYFD